MVHRPSDSRLLTNLLNQEKDYTKHLTALLDASPASLASFSAYASASSPPASHVILAVARSLAGADDALRRYATAVEDWRAQLKGLRDLEDEVANVMRDREILVTRLIKASKSHKAPKERDRDSIGMQPHQFPSSSDLSLRSDFTGPRSDFSGLPAIPTSAKLTAAQAELQACEAHLAAKERELAARRSSAVREGLSVRCRAMVECGWIWGEMGREALRVLEGMDEGEFRSLFCHVLFHFFFTCLASFLDMYRVVFFFSFLPTSCYPSAFLHYDVPFYECSRHLQS
ncbi:hypothetical protein BDZ94DRAFT_1155604 [Collybia nuda]|uniref:Uncharacterized protein n=1 Tax=Collybia nuda TaxID=64659 RepID=A0A9P6CPA8_9AGAR|nr:hypothetical protein BDZ94DRAFT_1155604 [Collybia nuda]